MIGRCCLGFAESSPAPALQGTTPQRATRRAASGSTRAAFSPHPHPVMADPPFAAAGVAEPSGGGEKEPAPTPHPQIRVAAVDRAQHVIDLLAMRIEVRQPVER